MSDSIEIFRPYLNKDPALHRQRWVVSCIDYIGSMKMFVSSYSCQTRKSTRAKWVQDHTCRSYAFYNRRDSTMAQDEYPLPDDVKKEAKDWLMGLMDKIELKRDFKSRDVVSESN